MNQSKPEKTVKKGTKYPALHEMGINNPSEIRLELRPIARQEGDEDVLRVHYKRAKTSFLPASRKYRFGRTSRTIVTDSGKPEYAEDTEISGFLQKAVSELNQLVDLKNDHDVLKSSLIDDLDHLEKYLDSKLNELRTQISKL